MNIIFIEAVQDHGGARKSTLELALRLQNSGENVLIVDFYGSNSDFLNDADSKELNLKILEKSPNPFILRNNNKIILILNYLKFYFELRKLKDAFRTITDDFKPDFIVTNNSKTLSVIPKSKRYKIILFARGWFLKKQISRMDRVVFKFKVDLYFAVSQATRHALFCGGLCNLDRIFVVKNGIDLNANIFQNLDKFGFVNNKINLIHSGGLLPSKGHHISIEISKELKRLNVPHKLVLTGKVYGEIESINYFEYIQNLISEYELEDFVDLIINKDNILEYIKVADILLHPSDSEGLPRVIMEAMALRTVVIANPVGGVLDYILDGYTGYLCNVNDVSDYIDKILTLFRSDAILREVQCNAFNLIKTCYTPDIQLEQVKSIFLKEIIRI